MTRFFVHHPVTTWMIFAAFVVLALYALPKIEVEAIPEVDLPSLTVSTSWNGASPKAIQRSITLPIEEAARSLHGVESVESESRAGVSRVTVEFRRDVDIDFARLELNEQLGSVRRNLPLNAGQPQIQAFVPEEFQTEQFFTFSIISPLPPNELREQAEKWILPQVLGVEGVADAQVLGGANPLVKVLLDREKLQFYGITAQQVFSEIAELDDLAGAGAIRENGLEKLVALREDLVLDDLRTAIVARRGKVSFTLEMLGELRPDYEDPLYFVRGGGETIVQIEVNKRSGGNSVVVSRALRAAVPEIEASLPFQASLEVDLDQGRDLEEKLQELLVRSLAILAVLFILLAISLRQVMLTAIVITSVIFALVICLSLFYFLQLSVNFVTISGLTICFGMLLDNSILVLDSIHRRMESLQRADDAGLSRRAKKKVVVETVVQGTGEVIFPILATTLTTIVAFMSFIFLSGRLALYYVPLAISVGLAMGASIFVAFGWIPVVLDQIWVKRLVSRSPDGPNELEDEDQLDDIVHILPDLKRKLGLRERALVWAQHLWPVTVAALVALGWFTWDTWDSKVVKGGFFRLPDPERIVLFMRMPEGTDIRVTSETLFKFEEQLMPVEEGAQVRSRVFSNIGIIEIEFEDELLRSGIPMLYRALLTEQADLTGGTSIYIAGFADQPYIKGNFGGAQPNSAVKVTGYNSKVLTSICEEAHRVASRSRRVRNASVTTSIGFRATSTEETVIELKRKALADHGLSVLDVTLTLRRLLGVDVPWRMLIDGKQERMQLAYTDADDIEFSDVAEYVIDTPTGEKVPLVDLITMETIPISDAITRENQRYSMYVSWEYIGTDAMRKAYLKSILDSIDLPYGYTAEESQREFFTEEEEKDLHLTLILALVFIFMVMAALFESVALPLLVLTSVLMAAPGVVIIFWKTTSAFDSSATIGLVLLFGIVVNNAILLVSRFRHECALTLKAWLGGDPEGEAGILPGTRRSLGAWDLFLIDGKQRGDLLRRAVARGTLIRMRSILLTSGTTVVGLLPLLVSIEKVPWRVLGVELPFRIGWMSVENQDIWVNLALSSIGGLISSTILLIVAMPAFYYGTTRIAWVLRRFGRWLVSKLRRSRPPVPVVEPVTEGG